MNAQAASAGYSGTPLPRKLGIKVGSRVLVVGSAPDWEVDVLQPVSGADDPTTAITSAYCDLDFRPPYDIIVAFCPDLAALRERVTALPSLITQSGRLWLCWPKKSSGVATDVTEDAVRQQGLATGLVDTKICAVDPTWSGLCFVRRRADRTSTGRARSR